jgi:hypothetical protein
LEPYIALAAKRRHNCLGAAPRGAGGAPTAAALEKHVTSQGGYNGYTVVRGGDDELERQSVTSHTQQRKNGLFAAARSIAVGRRGGAAPSHHPAGPEAIRATMAQDLIGAARVPVSNTAGRFIIQIETSKGATHVIAEAAPGVIVWTQQNGPTHR